MKIEAHACKVCGRIVIAVDGRRLTERLRSHTCVDVWSVVASVDYHQPSLPAAEILATAIVGPMLADVIRSVLARQPAPPAPKRPRARSSHLKLVKSKSRRP